VSDLPPVPAAVPRQGGPVSRALGRAILAGLRWRVGGAVPDVAKCVLVAAPHTSNWDFVVGIAAKLALGLHVHWLGKHTLFRRPFGGLLRRLGGIPVDREAAEGLVGTAVAWFERERRLFLGVTPEGTRRRVERWKSGFHRIALGAGVPILPVRLDWSGRTVELLPLFTPTPDYEVDLEALQSLFTPEMPRHPQSF
jgi:1-acyl-sn-glycerol-3-phosphate acyltransferase